METEEQKPKEYRLPINGRVEHELQNMRFIDLQRSCIVRGMDFNMVVSKSVGILQSWLIRNWHNKVNQSLLDAFDKQRENSMKKLGKGDEPFIRLGFIATQNEEGKVVPMPKSKPAKKVKVKRERDEKLGIFRGTKKSMVYDLAAKGKSVAKIIPLVIAKYPDAKPKSIKIWYKRATSNK